MSYDSGVVDVKEISTRCRQIGQKRLRMHNKLIILI